MVWRAAMVWALVGTGRQAVKAEVSKDLAWWRARQGAPVADAAALRGLLSRLRGWKAQHDADRAGQRNPFLLMAWDGVFGDEDGAVTQAIEEVEAALAAAGLSEGGEA